MSMDKPIKTSKASQDLSVGAGTALAHDYTVLEENIELLTVMIHSSANISETITVKHVDLTDPTLYIFTLDSTTLSTAANYVFAPGAGKHFFKRGDIIRVACTGATDPTAVVYSKIMWRECV